MSLESLNRMLAMLANQYTPPERKQFQHVLRYWEAVVGPAIAAHTQPLSIQRGVLRVATASSAWAQNLVFERQRILTQLNTRLPTPLTEIRFSIAQWQATPPTTAIGTDEQAVLWQEHPSRLTDSPESVPASEPGLDSASDSPESRLDSTQSNPADPQAAFQAWAARIRSRTQHLPLCPQCQCPTPPGELKRWSLCAVCAAKQW